MQKNFFSNNNFIFLFLLQISYPMEMHLIHFNNKYGPSVQTALDKSRNWYDTLAILGVWFQIRSFNNTNQDPLIKSTK